MTDPNKRTIYIQPETDAALKRIGGADRAKQIRRAVALAECAGELSEALESMLDAFGDCAIQDMKYTSAIDQAICGLDKYREIKHED